MTRLEKLLQLVRKDDKILEIGASYNPAASKQKGWNTRVLDHCTKEELADKYLSMHMGTKYNALTFDLSQIEEVDYVWHGGPLESAVPKQEHGTFDVCIASHVIEHTTDIVGFIKSIETLLKPGGIISLAVPDKRYCFDYFQPLSSTGNVIDAIGASRHSRGKVFNSSAYGILQNRKATWGPGILCNFELAQTIEACYETIRHYKASLEHAYIDGHGWFFTPSSFSLIIAELGRLGLINSHIHSRHPTKANEFFVTLKKGLPAQVSDEVFNQQRLDLLTSVQIDLLEQAYYNPRIRLSLRWKLNAYWNRLKEGLATAAEDSWLSPAYYAYKHYYRDRPHRPTASALSVEYDALRGASIHVIRSYHYFLTIGTRVGSWWRCLNSTPAEAVPHRILKVLSAVPVNSVVFVTYHPQGFISDHVREYIKHFKRAGFSVVVVKVVDDIDHPLANSLTPDVDAALVRTNAGYDFGAWAHGLHAFPEVYEGKTLWMANDSVFGPASSELFDRLLDRVEKSRADLVGLTENYQFNHHYQTYFFVFRNLAQYKNVIKEYWDDVKNIKGKRDVIFEYELSLKEHFSKLGMNCAALFPVKDISLDCNPTFFGWSQLLKAGFPFLKVPLLRPEVTAVDNSSCRDVFAQLGYDRRMIDQHFLSMSKKF